MGTVLDVITGALNECGQLGQGQTASPEDGAQGFRLLNLEIAKVQANRLFQFFVSIRAYTLTAGSRKVTLGPTGTLGGAQTRPVLIESFQANPTGNLWLPRSVWKKEQWDAIEQKGLTGDLADGVYVEYNYPNLALYFNPAPAGNLPIQLGCWDQLQQFASLFDQIGTYYPPEYEEWFEATLAVKMAPFYNQPVVDSMVARLQGASQAVQSKNQQAMQGSLSMSGMMASPNIGQPPPPAPAAPAPPQG